MADALSSLAAVPSRWSATTGTVVRDPERQEPGFWAGAPSVLVADGRFWLTYRERRPRGAAVERGWRCAVAVSDDGIGFDDVWEVRKEELETDSMERFCLMRSTAGFTLYLSYVDPADGRWRIDAVDAATPAAFDVSSRRPVLTATTTRTEGVKDPVVVVAGNGEHLLASVAAARPDLRPDAHATHDIYNVGATTHPTGVAMRSGRDEPWTWQGEALGVGSGWDRYQARIGSVVRDGHRWLATYDGSAGHDENYEERCGVAVSSDLRTWLSGTPHEPWLTGPGPTGSIRYADLHRIDGAWWLWAEVTRPDGAHDLRVLPRIGG